jgi:hypothetical protein
MTQVLQYQVRVNLGDVFARVARTNMADPSLKPLADVLNAHNATIKNQFDAFADFCAQVEATGNDPQGIYQWTKDALADPATEAKYATRFIVYVGDDEVYVGSVADAIEADLQSLIPTGIVTRVNKFDTNPANNPQPPKQG